MFGKVLIAFSALLALANAGAILPVGSDAAVVSAKQDSHGFAYKVDETNTRGVIHAAPVAYAAAPLAYGYGAPLVKAAHAVVAAPAVVAHHAPAAVVTKTVGYGAPLVNAYAAPAPAYYNYPARPYAFGYSYGAANVAAPVLAYGAHAALPVAAGHPW